MKTEYKLIKTTSINKDQNCVNYEDSMKIEDSIIDNLMDLYHFGIKEYGKCISKIYIDRNNTTCHIGYVFLKKIKYEDCNEYYLSETWLSLEHYIETIDREYLEV